jgi:hypothetical protein
MPFTLFHYPVAFGLSKIFRKLSLPGLIVGSFTPDIEVPILMLFFQGILPDHFILHSLIGALTIGTLLSLLTTRFLYALIVSKIFHLDKSILNEQCKISFNLVLSCLIGNVFHILLDVTMHPFNPILWPWVSSYHIIGPLVLLFAKGGDLSLGFSIANLLTNAIMIIIGIIIILIYRKNLWNNLFS